MVLRDGKDEMKKTEVESGKALWGGAMRRANDDGGSAVHQGLQEREPLVTAFGFDTAFVPRVAGQGRKFRGLSDPNRDGQTRVKRGWGLGESKRDWAVVGESARKGGNEGGNGRRASQSAG